MAGKRGYVHQCLTERCEWLGKRIASVHHYAKRHCSTKDAPFACDLCKFTTGSKRELVRHCEGTKHVKAMTGNRDGDKCVHRRKNEDEILKKFSIWSPEKAHWEVQLKEKTANETRSEEKKTPAKAPQSTDLIRVTPTSLENLDKEELIKRLMAACASEELGNVDEATEIGNNSQETEVADNSEAAEERNNGEAEGSSTREQKEQNIEEIELEQAVKSITAIPKTLSPIKDAVIIEK